MLNDGDTVTFGKSVGKGDEWVKPVVVLVQLLYAATPFNGLTVPSPSSSEKSKSSGRYGIHDSTSSEDPFSDSSDIEEIPPPQSSPTKMISGQEEPRVTTTTPAPKPLDQPLDSIEETSAYSAFKILIPAIRRLPSVKEIIRDKGAGLFDAASKPFPTLPALSFFPDSNRKEDDSNASIFNIRRRDINELRLNSRSSSPMDLGSPEPLAGVDSRQLSTPMLSPVIEYLDPSLLPLIDLPDLFPSQDFPSQDFPSQEESHSGVSEAASSSSPVVTLDDDLRPADNPEPLSAPAPAHPTTNETTENTSTASEISEMQRTLKKIEASVSKLHVSRRKYKNRFNANVSFMSNKLSEIDDKFAEVDAEYNVLCDQVEEIQHGDLPDFAKQIEDLNERIDAIIADRDNDRLKTPSPPPMPVEEIKNTVKSINDLIDEQRASHLKRQEELSKHLIDMTTAREETRRVIEQAKAILAASTTAIDASLNEELQVRSSPIFVRTTKFIQVVNKRPPQQTPVPTSLKRKRDEMDEDEGASVELVESAQVVPVDPLAGTADGETNLNVTMIDLAAQMNEDSTNAKTIDMSVGVLPPPRKKIRTIGSVVAQTATAVTIGAVITWSALAFS